MDVGDEVSVAVLDIDNTGRISLIIKDLQQQNKQSSVNKLKTQPQRQDNKKRY
jgi:predicted RNA-binding protein with RPS1 domain